VGRRTFVLAIGRTRPARTGLAVLLPVAVPSLPAPAPAFSPAPAPLPPSITVTVVAPHIPFVSPPIVP
jgi:hypothetical protein